VSYKKQELLTLPYINVREYRRGKSKQDNPEKLAPQGTQDEKQQNKSTAQCVLDTTMRKQIQIM
jgi:hypothetical protein